MPDSNEISLKEFFCEKISALEKAKDVALIAMDKRLDNMNEIKGAMKDQQANFITRSEFSSKIDMLEAKIDMQQKLLYIGVGGVAVIEIVFRLFVK